MLDKVERGAEVEAEYGISVAGSYLLLGGMDGERPDIVCLRTIDLYADVGG